MKSSQKLEELPSMVRMTPDILEAYLREYGWSYREHEDGQWLTGWQGADRAYPLRVSLCDTWVVFHVKPFLKLNVDWESWPEVSRFLLELNHSCHMVKLVVDERSDITLCLELFTHNLRYSDFADALGILGYYADDLYDKILSQLDQIGFRYAQTLNFLT